MNIPQTSRTSRATSETSYTTSSHITPAPPTSLRALHGLLEVTTALHDLTTLSRQLCETYFSQEHVQHSTPAPPEAWQPLCDALNELRGRLEDNLVCAEQLLARRPSPGGALPITLDWHLHAKRRGLLELFDHYRVDPRIVRAIDETLTEDAGAVLELLGRDWQGDLLAFLDELLGTLQALAPALENARDARTQSQLLTVLAPADADCGDDVPFDIFADTPSVMDLELTLAAIASYAVLSA